MRREMFPLPAELSAAAASRRFNLSRWAIDHGGFTAFLLVLLLAAGAVSFLRIGQKEDPDFTFRIMVVQVLWPGATVEEMQDQVVDKIERKLQETPGLDFVRSYTRPGFANIFVNLKGSVRGDAVKDAFYQARKKIGDIRQTLPEGVIGPFFNDEFGDTYISLYAITGAGLRLSRAEDLRQERARHSAARPRRRQGRSARDAGRAHLHRSVVRRTGRARALRARHPGGARRPECDGPRGPDRDQRAVGAHRCRGRAADRSRIFASCGCAPGSRRSGSATSPRSRRGLEDPPSAKTRYQGREAVLLGTTMAPGANVTEVGAEVERTLKRIEQDLPLGVELGRISDQAQVVTKSIHEFLEAFGEAIGIVLVVSLIALGWRAGLVVALTIPLVLAATFFVMSLMGIDLHRISLGALVIALGLLVDDAMIAVEMMDRKLEGGPRPAVRRRPSPTRRPRSRC